MSEVENMNTEQLRAHAQSLKDHYEKLQQYNLDLTVKLSRSQVREKRLIDEFQKAQVNSETQNMVVKYQLVFAKMESSFNRIFNSNRQRSRAQVGDAFHRIRHHAIGRTKTLSYQSHLVFMKLKHSVVQRLVTTYMKNRAPQVVLGKAFAKLKANMEVRNFMIRVSKSLAQEKTIKVQKKDQLVQSLQGKEKELTDAKALHTDLKQMVSQLKKDMKNLGDEVTNIQSKTSLSTSSQQPSADVDGLEQKLVKLQREETTLKTKLEGVEQNMASFMQEMGVLMDQHDVGDLFGESPDAAGGPLPENPMLLQEDEAHNKSGGGGTGCL